jgi:hypothetical protein
VLNPFISYPALLLFTVIIIDFLISLPVTLSIASITTLYAPVIVGDPDNVPDEGLMVTPVGKPDSA